MSHFIKHTVLNHSAQFLLGVCALFLFSCAPASKPPAESQAKLAVVFAVDQLGQDLIERYGHLFGVDGIQKLMTEGAWYSDCNFSHAATMTGPGHAIIGSGCNPYRTGIVANSWRQWQNGEWIYCVGCSTSFEVDNSGVTQDDGRSPVNLQVPALGGHLRSATNGEAKVWSMSLKDRAAVLMGGHVAEGAFWFRRDDGTFISSSYYGESLPQWCLDYNSSDAVDKLFKQSWERLLPDEDYRIATADDVDYETGPKAGLTNVLPKVLGDSSEVPDHAFYSSVANSPYGNDILLDLAKLAIEHENLGGDSIPDLLWIGLSSNDYCGHIWGPHSHELLDLTARTDRQIADFLNYLDAKVGLRNCLIALTGDHGVCPAPESELTKLEGGRLNYREMRTRIHRDLRKRFDYSLEEDEYIVPGVGTPWIYLDEAVIERSELNMDSLIAAVINSMQAMDGVDRVFDTRDMEHVLSISDEDLRERIRKNFWPGASGHLYMHVKPGWTGAGICTNHGTAHDYDTHVPLIFFGPGIKQGRYQNPADPADLAVTLAALLDLPPLSDVDGEVRAECLE